MAKLINKTMKNRYYKGVLIHQVESGISGIIRYYCFSDFGILRADTLAGIKKLIKKYK
jgi:hypothetical protein